MVNFYQVSHLSLKSSEGIFLLDANFEFLSAPSFESGGYDESQLGYVEEWTDWEGVDMAKIFGIYRTMAAQFHYDEILRLKGISV